MFVLAVLVRFDDGIDFITRKDGYKNGFAKWKDNKWYTAKVLKYGGKNIIFISD